MQTTEMQLRSEWACNEVYKPTRSLLKNQRPPFIPKLVNKEEQATLHSGMAGANFVKSYNMLFTHFEPYLADG